jgi:hypothetical protein
MTIGLKNRREINTAVPPYYLGTGARGLNSLVLAIGRLEKRQEACRCRAALKARKLSKNGCFAALKHPNLPW